MTRTRRDREASVLRWVEAARRLSQHRERHVGVLSESTGLSPEGVNLALDVALEADVTEGDFDALLGRVREAEHVTVVLSSNVFTAPLRAIAIAKAASANVSVRCSRREPVFASALAAYAKDPDFQLVNELDYGALSGGELHAYGSDETLQAIASQLRQDVIFRGHGTGFGIAYIHRAVDAKGGSVVELAKDVTVFDQAGCLSPRLVFVEGNDERADAVAREACDALSSWARQVPRGSIALEMATELRRYFDAMTMAGVVYENDGGAVVRSNRVSLPPAARVLQVVAVDSPADVRQRLGPLNEFVTTVGVYAGLSVDADLVHGRRSAVLGKMQSPRLDGPVDPRGWPRPGTVT